MTIEGVTESCMESRREGFWRSFCHEPKGHAGGHVFGAPLCTSCGGSALHLSHCAELRFDPEIWQEFVQAALGGGASAEVAAKQADAAMIALAMREADEREREHTETLETQHRNRSISQYLQEQAAQEEGSKKKSRSLRLAFAVMVILFSLFALLKLLEVLRQSLPGA